MKQVYIVLGLLISITLFSCGGGSGDNDLSEKKYRLKTLQIEINENGSTRKSTDKFNYDSDGNLHLFINGYKNEVDYIQVFTYNSNGKLLTQDWYYEIDHWYYEMENIIEKSNIPAILSHELHDASCSYTYDSDGNMLTNSCHDNDYSRTTTYTYDSNNNKITKNDVFNGLLERSEDDDGNIIPDKTIYTYDDKGNILTEKFVNYFGSESFILTYTYDEKGNKLTEEKVKNYTYEYKKNSHNIHTYTYNSNSKLLTDSFDQGADGVVDTIRTYTYDINGNMLTDSYDKDADGVANTIRTYTYDINGNKLTDNYDKDADGVADVIHIYTYDTNGNKLTDSYDKDADGTMDAIRAFTYDSESNVKTETLDKNADGTANYKLTYTYERAKIIQEISPLNWKSVIEYEWESLTAIR